MENTKKLFGFAAGLAAIALAIVVSMTGCKNPLDDAGPTPVTIAALQGVTAPVTGAAPVTAITVTKQYTGTITWSPADNSFKASTVYTATITLTAKTGFTLKGVAANFFTVEGATTTNAANSGVITAVFPSTAGTTAEPVKIDLAAISGVTAPVTGAAPVTAITETAQYTGTVIWSPAVSGTFAASTVYTATITLTAKNGFTLTGVAADFFTVTGATATNAANSGVITAVFPATGESTDNTITGGGGGGGSGGGGGGDVPPEDRPVKDRWGKWVDDTSTATLNYSVASNGVCTITIGGTAQPNNESDDWGRWKANAYYDYTAQVGTMYEYTFEAWTQSDTRDLNFQYNTDNDEGIYFGKTVTLTTTPQTYTVYGAPLSKGAYNRVEFQCANQLGTFYVRIIKIEELTIGKLTITNFSGSPGLTQNSWVSGYGDSSIYKDDGIFLEFINVPEAWIEPRVQIKGNTITIPVWMWKYDEDEDKENLTFVPFTGNITVLAGKLSLYQESDDYKAYYYNKVPITFTNGNATINFGTQMDYPADPEYCLGDYWYKEIDGAITITEYVGIENNVTIPAQINGKPVTSLASIGWDGVTSITIPDSITNIDGWYSFQNCTSLTAINVAVGNSAYSSQDGVLYNKDKTALIIYPGGKTGAFTILSSVSMIRYNAFFGCASLTSIIIPNSVTWIERGAFAGCASLTSVTIPNSVIYIGEDAFGGCISLTSVTFQGMIAAGYFLPNTFGWAEYDEGYIGDLRNKFYATNPTNGTPGTYTRVSGSKTWEKQP